MFPNRIDVISTPIVIDLDVNGTPEVLFTSRAGSFGVIRVVSGLDGTEVFAVDAEGLEPNATSPLAAGDIDRDGFPEIIAVLPSGNQLMALEHDGTLKWLSGTIEDMGHGGAAIADLEGDGLPEIIVGRQVLNNDGSLRWTGTGSRAPSYGQVSLVADLDRDGSPEIVAGNTAYRATGSIFWQNAAVPVGFNAVGNFDTDLFPEVAIVGSGEVWLLEHTGEVKWGPVAHPGQSLGGPPTVADFDGDGMAEIGAAARHAYAVFDTDGTVLWEAETVDASSGRTGSSVFDFEGDGAAEVVYADEVFLRVYRGADGTLLFEEPIGSGTTLEYPVIADIDNDGSSEILVAGDRTLDDAARPGIHAFGGSVNRWLPTRPIWNQHTYHITNINSDGTIPEREVNNWEVFNNYRQNVPVEGCLAAHPDLTASFARKVVDGTDVHITVRIGNGGGAAVGPQIPVAFYDGDPSAGGVLLTTATVNSLTARGFQDLEVTVPVGTQALPLWIVADDQGGLTGIHDESDETNNALNSRLFLTATPNAAPVVDAGEDQVATITEATVTATLTGTVTDDDLPIGVVNTVWG
ncbi:MAG: FG-GAP-like repeat-containing protein, partial [Vicinamibacteria bacterium]